jgi:hypothetical protein
MARETVLLSVVSAQGPNPVCMRAAEIVRERWGPEDEGRGGARCVGGAVIEAAAESGEYRGMDPGPINDTLLKVACMVGDEHLPRWNAVPGRTAEEVAEALERAAWLSPPVRSPSASEPRDTLDAA